jgi:hypothetical protein
MMSKFENVSSSSDTVEKKDDGMSDATLSFDYEGYTIILLRASGEFPTDIQNVSEGSLTMLVTSSNSLISPIGAEKLAREIVNQQLGYWIAKPSDLDIWNAKTDRDSYAKAFQRRLVGKATSTGIGFNKWAIDYTVENFEDLYQAELSLSYIVLR